MCKGPHCPTFVIFGPSIIEIESFLCHLQLTMHVLQVDPTKKLLSCFIKIDTHCVCIEGGEHDLQSRLITSVMDCLLFKLSSLYGFSTVGHPRFCSTDGWLLLVEQRVDISSNEP